jgi:hypothetical protein
MWTFPFGDVPEEVRQQMQQAADDQHALQESQVRELEDFIEGLAVDQAKMMRGIIRLATQDPSYGAYINGWLSHMLRFKFSICQVCGEKHEELSPEAIIAAHNKGAEA